MTLVVVILAAACGSPTPARHYSEFDRRKCAVVPGPLPSAADTAIWCAEDFIARNGYTDLSPSKDTMWIAFESIEASSSVTTILHERHNTLERRAIGVCESHSPPPGPAVGGYIVVFRTRDASYARWVTMASRYSDLRVQHVDFDLSQLDSAQLGCRHLAETTTRLHN